MIAQVSEIRPIVPPMPSQPPTAREPLWTKAPPLRPLAIGAVAGVLLTVGTQVAWGALSSDTFTLHATQVLPYSTYISRGGSCGTRDGSISTDTAVSILDGQGTVIATGQLGNGHVVNGSDANSNSTCQFPIDIADVPGGLSIYQIKVGSFDPFASPSKEAQSGHLKMFAG